MTDLKPLKDKTAIVTGGAKGIGRGIALALARRGANVVIADLDEKSAKSVVDEIKSGGSRSYFSETDVIQQWSTDQMVEATLQEYGNFDVLVNNAGVGGALGFTDRKIPNSEDWQQTFDVNVFGTRFFRSFLRCSSILSKMTLWWK